MSAIASGADDQPDIVGEVEVGAQNDLPSMTDVAGDDQPLQRDMERAQGRQRGEDGKFAKRETVKNPNVQGLTREEVTRQYKKAIADETDTAALDGVKPTRQDPAAKTDQRQPSKKGTLDTGKDGPADTTQDDAELKKAREHLKLDRWTDAKLSKLTREQILDFGKEAQEEHARKYAEGREQAAAKNGKGQPPRPGTADGDDDESAEFEGLAKEHFADFDDEDGKFGKSLAGFAKATHAKARATIEREVGAIATEARDMLAKIQTNLESQMRFEIGLRDLTTGYPKAATPEGRKELASRVNALTKDNPERDIVQTMREQAKGLWGEERSANAEREAKLRAARSGGHADLSSMGEAPRKRSDWEVGLEAVRKHITSAG